MFNKNVIDVLTLVNGITNSVILKFPQTVAISESQDMLLCIDLSELDSDEFPEVPLKDSLSDFLGLVKMFEEPTIGFEGNTINVSSDEFKSSYIMDNVALMDAYNKSPEQFTKTEGVPSVATFELTTDDINKLKSASGVFKDLSEIIFCSKDDEMTVSLGATNKFNAKSNTFSVTKPVQASKEFEIKIPVSNFKMLPVSDYEFDVKYNSTRDSYRILVNNKSLAGFKILMTVKV